MFDVQRRTSNIINFFDKLNFWYRERLSERALTISPEHGHVKNMRTIPLQSSLKEHLYELMLQQQPTHNKYRITMSLMRVSRFLTIRYHARAFYLHD